MADEAETKVDDGKDRGLYYRADDAIVSELRKWLMEAVKHKQPILRKRKRDHDMYAGDQWDEADRRVADDLKRPALTLNMILGIISAVEGEERESRADIKAYGVGGDDDDAVFAMNRILKWVMAGCGGEFQLSAQFRNMTIGGEDWITADVDYFNDPEGRIILEQVDDAEVFDDPESKCPVSSDSRFMFRVKMVPEDEIEAQWPGKLDAMRESAEGKSNVVFTDGIGGSDILLDTAFRDGLKIYDKKERKWAVVEAWWYQIEAGHIVVDDLTGNLIEKTPEEFSELETARGEEIKQAQSLRIELAAQAIAAGSMADPADLPPVPPSIQHKKRPVRQIYQAFFSHDVLLEKKQNPVPNLKRFRYVPARALLNRNKNEWFGIVRSITDPQLQHNVEQSVIVQLMQLMPKSSWMGPKGSFHNKPDWSSGLAQPGRLLEYQGKVGKPEPVPVPPIPRHLIDMAFSRPQAMRDICGVNMEMTGSRTGADTGVVIDKRKKAARTVLTPIFDNYRRMKIELGKVLLAYIQAYITPERQIRIIGPEGKPEQVVMTEAMRDGRYDIMVDEGSDEVNDGADALNILQTTLPVMTKAGLPMAPEFIDLLKLPPHIRDNWKRLILWQMTNTGMLPPPDWQPGDPVPPPALPPGMAPVDPNQPPMM